MIIAIDFDGTIVEHKYPNIGREIPFAIDTLKLLQNDGHRLILWSVREGKLLHEAVEWCRQHGIDFYAVNKNYPEEQVGDKGSSRKILYDIVIDDRNIGGLPDWGSMYQIIKEGKSLSDILKSEWLSDKDEDYSTPPKWQFWKSNKKSRH